MARLQINVSDQVAEQIDEYAEEIGISRNAMCAVLLYEGISSKSLSADVIDEIKKKISETSLGTGRHSRSSSTGSDAISDIIHDNVET